MQTLIEVFRMTELTVATRIRIIKELGHCINATFAANITEPIVFELVLALDSNDKIKHDEHYLSHVNKAD